MSDDSSKPALGAVSPRRAFAAQSSWESFPGARYGCVSESVGIALSLPADRFRDLGGLAIPSERTPRLRPVEIVTEKKTPVENPSKISSLHSGSRVESLAEE